MKDKFKKANENIIDVEFENITKNNNRKSWILISYIKNFYTELMYS